MGKKAAEGLPNLLPSKIVIVDGKVRRVEVWILWNGTPWVTIEIRRESEEDGQYFSSISDPEHGCRTAQGTLAEVTAGLHPKFQAQYRALFAIDGANETIVRMIDGFEDYEVEVQAAV